MAELRRLTSTYEFNNYLGQALTDRLMCRLHHEATQKRLLTEPKLTLTKAIKILQSLEAPEQNSQQIKEHLQEVLKVIEPVQYHIRHHTDPHQAMATTKKMVSKLVYNTATRAADRIGGCKRWNSKPVPKWTHKLLYGHGKVQRNWRNGPEPCTGTSVWKDGMDPSLVTKWTRGQ